MSSSCVLVSGISAMAAADLLPLPEGAIVKVCVSVGTVETGRQAATWRGRVWGPAQCTVRW
jgi:hypothetical protein